MERYIKKLRKSIKFFSLDYLKVSCVVLCVMMGVGGGVKGTQAIEEKQIDQKNMNKSNNLEVSDLPFDTSLVNNNMGVNDAFEALIVLNGVQNLPCTFKVLTASSQDNLGTVQIGEGNSEPAIDKTTSGMLNLPNEVSDGNGSRYIVTTIANNAFYECAFLTGTGLETNTTITTIGNHAFSRCASLISTELEKNTSVKSLGEYVFCKCISLKNTGLEKNKTIKSLGSYTFIDCISLKSTGLNHNSTLVELGCGVFCRCTALNSTGLETNKTITVLPSETFMQCIALKKTGLEKNTTITNLGERTFEGCVYLGDIIFQLDTLPEMQASTFYGSNVKIYYLPEAIHKPTITTSGASYVGALAIKHISIKVPPTKVNYTNMCDFDPTGLVLDVTYEKNISETRIYNNETKDNFSFDKTKISIGDKDITITYGGKTIKQPISVKEGALIKNH